MGTENYEKRKTKTYGDGEGMGDVPSGNKGSEGVETSIAPRVKLPSISSTRNASFGGNAQGEIQYQLDGVTYVTA